MLELQLRGRHHSNYKLFDELSIIPFLGRWGLLRTSRLSATVEPRTARDDFSKIIYSCENMEILLFGPLSPFKQEFSICKDFVKLNLCRMG